MYIFTQTEARKGQTPNPRGHKAEHMTVNCRGRYLTLSLLLCKFLGLHAGAHISFALSDDGTKAYIRRADDPDDSQSTQTAKAYYNTNGKKLLQFSCSEAVRAVLSLAGAHSSCTCHVTPNPTFDNETGKTFYQILTSFPIMIN